MDTEKNLLNEAFVEYKDYFENVFERLTIIDSAKSAKTSEDSRNEGNKLFKQTNRDAETYIEIFRYYCESIAFAPLDSDSKLLVKAYANRSAFLLYIHRFKECIEDVDRAFNITKSDVLKSMLLCRKAECMKNLALPNCESVLDEAEKYNAKVVDKSSKARIDQLINKVKACSISNSKVPRDKSNLNDILPQNDQIFNCISIEHNEKYGRHLIAKKDYNPGDFIFNENIYVTVLKRNMRYTNCNYCLKICWAGIPCDYCSWAMFCSENCKTKAWDAFHDIECSVIPCLKKFNLVYFEPIEISLRLLLLGIREAGSIDKLKEDLKLVDQCTDVRYKGFKKNGQFTNCTIQSVYSLTSRNIFQMLPTVLAKDALFTLVAIIKHGKLIGNIKVDKIDDIVTKEDLVFLGSLLIRFALITVNNIFSMSCDCQRLKRLDSECCDRGSSLTTLASLMNHSCNPNAMRIFTEDRKINIFALQPIKKNSQIFITYAGFYYNKTLNDRKQLLAEYNFTCECKACIESWPSLFHSPFDALMAKQSAIEKKLQNACKDIFEALYVNEINFDKRDVEKVCKTIVQANTRLTEPTFLMASLQDSLLTMYSRIYGWESPIHAFGKFKNL